MNAMSNNWKPEILSSGKAGEDNLYSASQSDMEQEDLITHIEDKKTKQLGRMVEVMIITFVAAIAMFSAYKVYLSI